MRLKVILGLFFSIASLVNAQQVSYSPLLDEIENFNPADLKAMQEMHPHRAAVRLGGLISKYNIRPPEAKPYRRALAQELLKHPQLKEALVSLLRETPRHYDTVGKIGWVWWPLQEMRASWVVRLLGEELMDDTPVTQPGASEEEIINNVLSSRWASDKFQSRAVFALAHRDLPHAPFDETSPKIRNIYPNVIDEWKTWYVEHGDEVIAQLEAEEAERAKLETAAIAAAKAKAERYKNRISSPPAPPRSSSNKSDSPKSLAPRWAIGIALAILIFSIFIFFISHFKNARTRRS